MVAILGFSREKVLAAVREMYTEVAAAPGSGFHFPVGRSACLQVGYSPDMLDGIPPQALESFAGVGCPFHANAIRAGDRVLDLGSGSGTDALIAARLAGAAGSVVALDMTAAMSRKLASLLDRNGIRNVRVIRANAEAIPLAGASIDVATTNGVLNLVPDKRRAVDELFRVLRPGGRLQVADVVIARPVTPDCAGDPRQWAECVVGAAVDEDYLALFREAGFEEVTVLRDHDYFALSASADTREVAGRLGARAVEIAMRRGAAAPSPWTRLARRWNPRRLASRMVRRGWGGAVALALAMAACYGALAAAALAPVAGLAVAIEPGWVSAAVLAFAALALGAVAAGHRRHRATAPLACALLATALIGYAHWGEVDLAVELGGFVMMALAVALDLRAARRAA